MRILLALFLICYLTTGFSQGILIDTSANNSPDPSAILEIKSQSKGVLLPRMTALERIEIDAPQTGLLVYDLDVNSLFYYDGSDWVEFSSGKRGLRDKDFDTSVRVQTNNDDDTIRFKIANHELMKLNKRGLEINDGQDNILIGKSDFPNFDLNTNNNIAIGDGALTLVGDAQENIAIGRSALGKLVNLNSNTAVGFSALANNTTSANTAVGAHAGESTTGSSNVFMGYRAGEDGPGTGNAFIGSSAGLNHSGSQNICIGNGAGWNGDGNRNIIIGNYLSSSGSDKLVINSISGFPPLIYGEFDNDILGFGGNVAINHQSPATALHVMHKDDASTDGFRLENEGNGNFWRMYVRSSNGNMRLYSTAGGSDYVAWIDANSGSWNMTSDLRKKKNFERLGNNTLDKIDKLQILKYHYKSQNDSSQKHIGVIAQELEPHFPEVIHYDENQDLYTVNYDALGPIALKAIQELIQENKDLKKQIASIESRLDRLESEK